MGTLKQECINALLKKRVTALAYEFIEDKVGGMPIVRAMSEIAGSTVMLIAAEYLSTVNKGKGNNFRWYYRSASYQSSNYWSRYSGRICSPGSVESGCRDSGI
jgi:hypothetical protein